MTVRVARAVGLVLAVTALAACSGGGDEAPPDGAASPRPTRGSDPTPVPYRAGPLEEILGWGEAPSSEQDVVSQVMWRENLVAACMAEQGFEYWPQVPAVDDVVYGDGPVYGTREFAELYGYGIWEAPSTSGGGISFTLDGSANMDYREAMGDAEREAYDLVLWGPVVDVSEDGRVTQRRGGCSEAADSSAGSETGYLVGVREEGLAFLEALGADSRLAEVDTDWASCMADAGFTGTSPIAAEARVAAERVAADGDLGGQDVVPQETVDEKAAAERRLALADLDCREETDWAARHRAIEITLQQEYVDAHRTDLEALVAAMEPVVRED